MKTIGENIAAFRKEKQLTQEELAEKMAVTPQAVSKWECDSSYPDVTVMQQLARVLGVTVDEILNGRQEFPVLKQAEPEKIDRRILSIHVAADNNNTSVKARFPVSMVNIMLSNGLLAKLLFDTDDDDDADEKAEVEKTLQMLRSFIEEGVTGPLMQVNTSGTHVSIEVIEYES
ncbi:MAG: helix-turn-helix transcriptional regulator [Clostridia bacterium]|nr:helix-turn-helix transcriptional regulator [Clostridia bacterium]